MNKIITILMAMLLILVPLASAGYTTVSNPYIQYGLDYVRDGNWSDYNGTLEFPSIDVAGGYSGGGVSIYDTGDLWTAGDIYIDNGTVFLVQTPVINGTFLPAITNTFGLGNSAYSWDDSYINRILFENGTESLPSITFKADPDTGLYHSLDGRIAITLQGSDKFTFVGNEFFADNSNGPDMLNEDASATNPTFAPTKADPNTGLGWVSADILSLISGGISTLQATTTYINTKVPLRLDNDQWLQSWNNATDSNVNMMKVNGYDEVVMGSNLNLGGIRFTEDSGAITFTDMPVSSSATVGDEMSYAFNLDGSEVFKVYAQADGSGGIENESLRVSTDNGIVVGAGSSGDTDVTVLSVLESEGITGKIKWDDGLTAWDMTEPLGSFRFSGSAISMTGVFTSANGNGLVDTSGSGLTGLILSSQDAVSPNILIDPNRDGSGNIYLGNDEADNVTIRDGDRFIVEGFDETTYNCTIYDGSGNCILGHNSTCNILFSPDGNNMQTSCN